MGWLNLALFRGRFSGGGDAGEIALRIRRDMATTRGNKVAEKMVGSLKMYRISLNYFYRDIQLLQLMVAENEVADDYIPHKIDSRQGRGRGENNVETNI